MNLTNAALAEINLIIIRELKESGVLGEGLDTMILFDLARSETFFTLEIDVKKIINKSQRFKGMSRGERLA